MAKGVAKTIVNFFICLTLGVIIFRLDEVWNLIKGFYMEFSWEMMGTVLFTGLFTGMNAMIEWSSWKDKKKKQKKESQ